MNNRSVEKRLRKQAALLPQADFALTVSVENQSVAVVPTTVKKTKRPILRIAVALVCAILFAFSVFFAASAEFRSSVMSLVTDTSTNGTVSTAATTTKAVVPPDLPEVAGYDAYKADAVTGSRLAEMQDYFRPDDPVWIYTWRVIPGNFTGAGADVFVVYAVAQAEGFYPDSSDAYFGFYYVYALVSGGRALDYIADPEYNTYPGGTLDGEAADVDGDGRDEVVLHCDTGGSGGSIDLRVYDWDGDELIPYPVGHKTDAVVGPAYTPVSLQATIQPDGNYIMASPDTGYSAAFHSDDWNWPVDEQHSTPVFWDDALKNGFGVDTVVSFSVGDVDGDGIAEISVVNLYWYYTHAGKCGAGLEVYKYDAALGRFKAVWTTYFREEDTTIDSTRFYTDLGAVIKQLYK